MSTLQRLLELSGIRMVLTEMSEQQAENVFRFYGEIPAEDLGTLKSQFYKLANKYHPDRSGDPEAMKEINYAYEILKDKVANGNSGDEEEIRRAPGSAFEDFSDREYFLRRIKSVSGASATACKAYAFNGREFTLTIPMEASFDAKVFELISEGMITQNKGQYTKVVGIIWKSEPRKFYIIKENHLAKVSYMNISPSNFMADPTKDQHIIAELTRISK